MIYNLKAKIVSAIFALCLVVSMISLPQRSMAATLSTTTTQMQEGNSALVRLYFHYGKEKVKWSLSNKKVLKIVKKSKKSCKVQAKKAGSCYVKCKVGKKTYKKKITVKAKSPVTYENYDRLEHGMELWEVEDILGKYSDIDYSRTHTEEEYQEYLEWNNAGGGWEEYLYHEQVRYKWRNPWDYHTIYVTFNDGIMIDKTYM